MTKTLVHSCIFLISALNMFAVEIIAHRGASKDAPENTVAAWKLGWEQKADAGELDIHFSKDRRIVVMHDASTKRTAGVNKTILSQTLAELRELDAGSWKGPQWKGEKIPTLAEALATIPDGKRMFVEIKCRAEVLPELNRVIKESGKKPSQVVLIGFDYATMQMARERFPELEIAWLASKKSNKQGHAPTIEELIEKARLAKFDGLDLDYKFQLDAAAVKKVKAAGLKLYVWTVDDAAVARSLAAAGVDGITTNRPGWMREQLH